MSTKSLNKVQLIGNLTRDPVLKYTPKNTAVCNFSIATNRSWTTGEGGEKREEVDFHNVVVWTKLAEICGEYLHKGDKVYLEGRLQTRKWQDKEGQDRYTTEVVVENMIMLSQKSGSSQGGTQATEDVNPGTTGGGSEFEADPAGGKVSKKKSKKTQEQASDAVESAEDIADDIPF